MKRAWAVMAVVAGCGAPPWVDFGGPGTTSVAGSTGASEPTAATGTSSSGGATAGEACDPAVTACTGEVVWVKAFAVTGASFFGQSIEATTLALAPDGDIVAAGMFGGTIEFADQSIAAIGALDLWVARFGADGAPRWFRRFGGPDPAGDGVLSGAAWSPGNLAFDPDGDILVAAHGIGTLDFGFGPLAGDDLDPVVLRLSPSGQARWAHRYVGLGGGDGEFPVLVAPAGDGRVWLAGTLIGPGIDLGGGVLHSAGWGDVLLAQLDADGDHLWSRRAGDPGHQEVRAIAAAPDGGLVIAGALEGSLELGAGLLVSAGTQDAFVARLDHDGVATWSHRYGENHMESSLAVDVDPDGGVLLVGDYYGSTIDLGGGPLDASSWLFFAGLGPDGSHVWSTALPELMTSLDRGDDGTLVLGGFGTSSLMFPDGVWGGGVGPWVASFGPDASPRWERVLAVDEYANARAVAGPRGAAIVVVTIRGAVEFDGVTVGAPDRDSLVLARFGG